MGREIFDQCLLLPSANLGIFLLFFFLFFLNGLKFNGYLGFYYYVQTFFASKKGQS